MTPQEAGRILFQELTRLITRNYLFISLFEIKQEREGMLTLNVTFAINGPMKKLARLVVDLQKAAK